MSSIELPSEVWVEILSPLNHYQLKKCEQVSKNFQTLILNTPVLAKTVFRTRHILGPGEITNVDDVKMHPVFQRMMYSCSGDIEELELYDFNDTSDGPRLFSASAAAKENATEPPVNVLRMQIHERPTFQVKAKPGTVVTAFQAMEAVCRFFSGKAPPFYRAPWGVTWGDAMYDHNGWTGWDVKSVDSRGRLVLQAHDFDS